MFQEVLQKITTHVEGVQGCVLLDSDSVPIAELYGAGDRDAINFIAIELTNLVGSLRKRNVLEEFGAVTQFMLSTERAIVLGQIINDEYVLLTAMDPTADLGRGATMLRLMAPWVKRIL